MGVQKMMTSGKLRLTLILVATVTVGCLGGLVWSTRYRYDRITFQGGQSYPVRVDRITGRTQMLTAFGWKTLGTEPSADPELPASQLRLLTTDASISSDGRLQCNIYNGSEWDISELTVLVSISDASGAKTMVREYRLSPSTSWHSPAPPLLHTRFSAELGFTLDKGQTWSWSIARARGRRSAK